MKDCIFCKIAKKEIPSDIVYEGDNFIVFKDIHPKAPIHLLIVSKKHIDDMRVAPENLWSQIQKIALVLEKKNNLDGFRLGTNTGNAAAVKHMHVHFLGGITKEREI